MRRVASVAVTPLVRTVEWLFGPGVPGIHVLQGAIAAIWATLMLARPETFDTGRFVGMQWLPDRAWITIFSVLGVMHLLSLFRAGQQTNRMVADLVSAWIWLSISASFLRVEVRTAEYTPGTLIYALLGLGALGHAIYCAGHPRPGA